MYRKDFNVLSKLAIHPNMTKNFVILSFMVRTSILESSCFINDEQLALTS